MSKTNALKLAVLVLILGATGYLALRQRPPHALEIGERAPDFSVPAFPSGTLDLNNYHQQIVVLNFWATWCPPCVEESPSLERFAERMREHGIIVLSVSVDEDARALQDFIQKEHISFAVGRDPEATIPHSYGTFQFPETYILDRHGRLAEKIIGAADWNDPRIENFVLELARGSNP